MAGSAPTAAELAAALQRHAFFLYCGHGGGEQYISGAYRQLRRIAVQSTDWETKSGRDGSPGGFGVAVLKLCGSREA